MKVLEAQNALISNFEVYQRLLDHQTRKKEERKKMPGNLATMTREVLQYLRTPPGPLRDQDTTGAYSPLSISKLMASLRAAGFQSEPTKAELLSILNIRPNNSALLSTAIEDLEERFTEDEQAKMIDIITEVLGQPPQANGDDHYDEDAMEVEAGS
ncbi:hypothetical protein GQ53DRAFT_816738 [Thozetella sp. PMI_491]|nr:hypothetical protein GQ53DRAFT_816738 [Thozetella sp. PMI_491]